MSIVKPVIQRVAQLITSVDWDTLLFGESNAHKVLAYLDKSGNKEIYASQKKIWTGTIYSANEGDKLLVMKAPFDITITNMQVGISGYNGADVNVNLMQNTALDGSGSGTAIGDYDIAAVNTTGLTEITPDLLVRKDEFCWIEISENVEPEERPDYLFVQVEYVIKI